MTTWIALAAAVPWVVTPLVVLLRARASRTLDEESGEPPAGAPTVAVIIPARNEAHNIARCARSVLASRYPALEVLVVDDRSDDGTGDVAREIARADARLRVLESPPLPPGWFGKQWACAHAAAASTADLLCFTDADTEHGPDLLPRAVNAMRARGADLLSVAGGQEMVTFWERVVQPQVFTVLLARYGGTEVVNRARRAIDKIASGAFLLIRRDAYEALGGHAAVRHTVAEDLALAQRFFAAGRRTALVLGVGHLSVRMYTSLRESVDGWMKNIYAGARESVPGGALGRALLPGMLLAPWLMLLAPPIALAAGLAGLAPSGVARWGALCTAALLGAWALLYAQGFRLPARYAFAFPLGAAVMLYTTLRAVARGRRVRWKGREYESV